MSGKCTRVRIAVVVDTEGFWAASGYGGPPGSWAVGPGDDHHAHEALRGGIDFSDGRARRVVFVEAEVPCAESPVTVEGEVA